MHAGSFFSNTQTGCNSQRQADRFDHKRTKSKEAFHYKSGNDAFDLADTRTGGVRCEALYQPGRGESEHGREEDVDDVVDGPKCAPVVPLGATIFGAPAAE